MSRRPHPLAGTSRRLASGAWVTLDERGVATIEQPEEFFMEGPTCSLCDALGHGYPGGGPCPLEEQGWEEAEMDRRMEAMF